jgi:hypothetical protein
LNTSTSYSRSPFDISLKPSSLARWSAFERTWYLSASSPFPSLGVAMLDP